jgi:hypothetical protein
MSGAALSFVLLLTYEISSLLGTIPCGVRPLPASSGSTWRNYSGLYMQELCAKQKPIEGELKPRSPANHSPPMCQLPCCLHHGV